MRSRLRGVVLIALGVAFASSAPQDAVGRPASGDLDMQHVRIEKGRAKAAKATSKKGEADEDVPAIGLTLDVGLQRVAERILAQSKAPSGAVVVSDVRTGRVLVWATSGEEGDLVRRAKYPGASLMKVVTAAALLDKDRVRPAEIICFSGGESRLHAEDIQPGCRAGDERTRFDAALGKSINGVFGRLAVKHLPPAELERVSKAFGIGDAPPLDLPADRTSIRFPADDLGLARAAAGFGEAKMSPLAALYMMQTIANGGERVRLHVTGVGADVPRVSMGRAISKDAASALVRMLEVTTRSGTSKKAFEAKPDRPTVSVAGKTGTLMTKDPKRLVSWFAGFAPSREPEIAVAVLLANDEKWWRKGNEVARDVIDAYFEAKKKD